MLDGYHNMWGMHWGWWVFWLLFVLIVVWLLAGGRGRAVPPAPPETPLDILKRRYAAGEISTEDYEERKARLERND